MAILKEGGNIFKDPDSGNPLTQRIARDDVDPTLGWVEKLTNLSLKDAKLGSTGIRSSSGDLDVAVDQTKNDKEQVFQKLKAWAEKTYPDDNPRQWVAKSGTNVHLRTPINGNPANGFVQTDLMFGNPEWMKFALRGMGDDTPYKGSHRMIMLASIAKAQGMMWSPTKGLVDRETKQVITTDPNEIAVKLIGQGASRANLDSVETIHKAIKNRSDYDALVADVKDNFEKQGIPMPETKNIRAGLMLAEKNIFQKAASGLANIAKTGYAGYKAGRASPKGFKAAADAYKKAGGGKTTIGQTADLLKKTGRKITGTPEPTDKNKDGKDDKTGKPIKKTKAPAQTGPVMITIKKGFSKKKIPASSFAGFSQQGWKQVESVNEGARIDHAEDLVYRQGSQGAMRVLQSLRQLEQGGHKDVTIKWDGSPAIIFGRNENGEFVLTDKSGFVKKGGVERATSGEDLEQFLLNRGGGKKKDDPDRIKFAGKMKTIFPIYEKSIPEDYRGFFKGDLLYYTTPPVQNQNYVFEPNIVEYAVDVNSDLGKKIGNSTSGVVVHREIDIEGNESPIKDMSIFKGNQVLVVPPVSVETPPKVNNEQIDRLEAIIKKDAGAIDSLLDKNKLQAMKVSDFDDILYKYTNSKVDTGLDNLGRDFVKWLTNSSVSRIKQQKIIEYIKQNMQAFSSLWEVVNGIMDVKNDIIKQLDSQGQIKAKLRTGDDGGEGYVLAHPGGDIKLVNRAGFSAANRAVQR